MKPKGLLAWLRGVGRLRSGFVATAMVLAIHGTAANAWAQKQAGLPDDDQSLIRIGIAVGVIVIIGLPAFLNPKRSHLT